MYSDYSFSTIGSSFFLFLTSYTSRLYVISNIQTNDVFFIWKICNTMINRSTMKIPNYFHRNWYINFVQYCLMALSGSTISYCVNIRLDIRDGLFCSFRQLLMKVYTAGSIWSTLLGVWSDFICRCPLYTPTLIPLQLSMLDLWRKNCNWNGHASYLLHRRSIFNFFFLAVVVILNIESRSDETRILDADQLLPLILLVQWAYWINMLCIFNSVQAAISGIYKISYGLHDDILT